jgi:ankyrin repeat protein
MSSTWIDFIAIFEETDRCEAVHEALLAARVGGDTSRWNAELDKMGATEDEDDRWSSDLIQRDEAVLTGEIQGSASSEPREWLSELARLGATAIAAEVLHDQVGEREKLWLIHGKRASKAKLFEVLAKQSLNCALMVAMEQLDRKQVEELLDRGADPNTRVFGRPPIVVASESGRHALMQALVRAGADVNAHDRESSAGGLLERGGTALHDVVGSIKMVRFLLSAGADIHARNSKGQTPLHLAALQHVHLNVFRALLKAGAEIDARDKRGVTPLMTLFQSGAEPENAHRLMQFLMSQGADLEARDAHGGNALWHAQGSGLESLLLAEGMTLEIPDDAYIGNLRRDLDTAITVDDKPKFAELVDRIGELSPEEAHRVLEWAVLRYRVDFVEALAARGVDVNRRNREGYAVLEIEKICREDPQSENSKKVIKVLKRFGKAGR